MRSIVKATVVTAIALMMVFMVVPSETDADRENLYCTGVEYEDGMMKVNVNLNVAGEVFVVTIDGETQTMVAFGQEGKWILVVHDASDTPERFVLKNDAYTDVTFTYPESSAPSEDGGSSTMYIIIAVVLVVVIIAAVILYKRNH